MPDPEETRSASSPAFTAHSVGANAAPKLQRGVDTGTHFTFCGGFVTLGPDWKSFLMSVLILLAPSVIFMVFVAPWLGQHLSWALFVISIVLILVTISLLFATALTNPGYLPRDTESPVEDIEWGRQHPAKEFQVHGGSMVTKWCTTCDHYRPPRCSHCAVCDNCVDKFDHHCPWVGTCVGRRNYRYFLAFIFTATLLCAWVFALSLAQLFKYSDMFGISFGRAIGKQPASIVCMGYTFLAFWFVGGLSAFHVYLCCSNQTTYEHFRHRHSGASNPYNQGLSGNVKETCCVPIPTMKAIQQLGGRVPAPGDAGRPLEPMSHVGHMVHGTTCEGVVSRHSQWRLKYFQGANCLARVPPRGPPGAYQPYAQGYGIAPRAPLDPNSVGPPPGWRLPHPSEAPTAPPGTSEVELPQRPPAAQDSTDGGGNGAAAAAGSPARAGDGRRSWSLDQLETHVLGVGLSTKGVEEEDEIAGTRQNGSTTPQLRPPTSSPKPQASPSSGRRSHSPAFSGHSHSHSQVPSFNTSPALMNALPQRLSSQSPAPARPSQ